MFFSRRSQIADTEKEGRTFTEECARQGEATAKKLKDDQRALHGRLHAEAEASREAIAARGRSSRAEGSHIRKGEGYVDTASEADAGSSRQGRHAARRAGQRALCCHCRSVACGAGVGCGTRKDSTYTEE